MEEPSEECKLWPPPEARGEGADRAHNQQRSDWYHQNSTSHRCTRGEVIYDINTLFLIPSVCFVLVLKWNVTVSATWLYGWLVNRDIWYLHLPSTPLLLSPLSLHFSSHKTITNHVLSSSTSFHPQTSALGEKIHPISQTSPQTYIPVAGVLSSSSKMPGPMSDAGSAVSSSVLSGWSSTSGGTGVETSQTPAQTCTSQFFSPPAAEQSLPTEFAVSDPEPYQQQHGVDFSRRASLLESFYAGRTRMSATLPRGFRRSEGCMRLSMGVTPRPFGAKPTKVSSLPKVYAVSVWIFIAKTYVLFYVVQFLHWFNMILFQFIGLNWITVCPKISC